MNEIGPPMTGPLRIDWIELASGGRVGMTNCPGRKGVDGAGRLWARDLDADLATIERSGASVLISLVEPSEFARLGVADFAAAAKRRAFTWARAPIPDMQAPGEAARAAWRKVGPDALARLRGGESVVFHCAAGLGRTGAMVAKLLVDAFGMSPVAAIELVRSRRPGAIESRAQEQFVAGPALTPDAADP